MSKQKTVLAHGCFDLIHLGHIRHLEAAKELGDWLIVSVTSDRFVNKGPGRPRFTAMERCEALEALKCVDAVYVNDAPNAAPMIHQIMPDIYVKGVDYAGVVVDWDLEEEIAAVKAHGGEFLTTDTRRWSSSNLLRVSELPDNVQAYLDGARKRGFLDQIIEAFDKADKLRIAFVGETIFDEYRFVRPLAKPAKEHILATVATNSELWEGGIVAAALHGDWPNSQVVTSHEKMYKIRFVHEAVSRKLFELYGSDCLELDSEERALFRTNLARAVIECDVVVVIDFGHGLMEDLERACVADAKFLAVATQNNAGNYGFNSVFKYDTPDYVCIDEPEARLSVGKQFADLPNIMGLLNSGANSLRTTITRGHHGSVTYPFIEVPAFFTGGIDTMGAGDAFLAVTAPLIAAGLGAEQAAFVGNVAGGLKTTILGHRDHVRRADLIRNIEHLLG